MAEESGPHPMGGVDCPRTLLNPAGVQRLVLPGSGVSGVSAAGSVAAELPLPARRRGPADERGPPEVRQAPAPNLSDGGDDF